MGAVAVTVRSGTACFVYEDELADLLTLGEATVRRASFVEPDPAGGWLADMGPSNGPVLRGFSLRREALEAERAWLRAHKGV